MRSIWIACTLAITACGQNQDPLLWGGLKPGPYSIGYRSYFEFDPSRSFDAGGSVRPILVNMWYPAQHDASDRLRYGDYLKIPPLPQYPNFVSNLERFLLDTLSDDLFRKKWTKLNPNERRFAEVLLSKPIMAHRVARAATGKFPIILYHAGAAGSFEENSVMLEYLASHGYVVITSAFQSADGQHVSNNYVGPETSWHDLAFLLKHARSLPFTDASKVGAIGHSMGAQYLLEWLGQRPSPPLSAVVSLDTTLEYTPEDFEGHRSLRSRFASLKPVTAPVLVAASAERSPRFSTWDRYLREHTDVSIPHFKHGDFLVHGSLARAYNRQLAAEVRSSYDHLVVAVRSFLDAMLRGA
ncbi:MAG TPA: hypothetical protein VEX68_00755 [Bryobacteraceae bacterium]|nr:hypothetical protein [Bryobacteraceae bacterium]